MKTTPTPERPQTGLQCELFSPLKTAASFQAAKGTAGPHAASDHRADFLSEFESAPQTTTLTCIHSSGRSLWRVVPVRCPDRSKNYLLLIRKPNLTGSPGSYQAPLHQPEDRPACGIGTRPRAQDRGGGGPREGRWTPSVCLLEGASEAWNPCRSRNIPPTPGAAAHQAGAP